MIDALEKVRILKAEKERVGYGGPFLLDICPSVPMWQLGELEEFAKAYPFLPKAYLDYLKEFDSTSVAFCNFFGSRNADGLKLHEEVAQHRNLLKDNYFPFASDADGSVFLFDKQGKVRWWDIEDYDFEQEPKVFAENFEELVGECLLGKRYSTIDYINLEKNSFFAFLKSQGWV